MKKGFTLIELMVVIVIMGALAAIGVPKLFGVIAKAKASEIHTAAGTYIHLQDAYLANKPGPGSWKDIGYGAPGNGSSKNFCYNSGNLESAVLISEIPENTIGWGASNLNPLNECGAGSWWSIVITQQGEHDLNYSKNVNNAVCGNLTNSWNVGTTLSGECASPEVAQKDPETQPGAQTGTPSGTEPSSKDPEPETPTTPPSKEVNLEEYYTYANGEYQKCNSNGKDSWLNGGKNGNECKPLRDLLYDNGDLVLTDKGNNNHYNYKDDQTRCLVTRDCSDNDYATALAAKRAEEEAKKKSEEETAAGDNGNQNGEEGNTNQGTDVDNTNQNSSEEMICSATDKSGNCLTTRPKSECKEFKKDGSCKKWK
ncbi:MAG: type II secretion system GspH family protein [Fibrobacter sp.]|nr:type II secretion system GspH family protein [Fibrobacter sp.]